MRLIVHIGNGKTGTTSIQNSLNDYQSDLNAAGFYYLGRTLEHGLNDQPANWQSPNGAELLLHQMPEDQVEGEVLKVLRSSLERLKDREYHTAIWSNEALFARHFGVIPALRKLQTEGVDVQIVLYLRRHDKWAKSAYAQWGIRHKSYQGPVLGFKDWLAKRPVRFGPNLRVWNDAFGVQLNLRNFDEISDVSEDFFTQLGLPGQEHARVYETPSVDALIAQALFNDRFPGVVYPDQYRAALRTSGLKPPSKAGAEKFQTLLPTAQDLNDALNGARSDLDFVNDVLRQKGQPVFSTDPVTKGAGQADPWTLLVFLMQSNFTLAEQVARLEKEITELRTQ